MRTREHWGQPPEHQDPCEAVALASASGLAPESAFEAPFLHEDDEAVSMYFEWSSVQSRMSRSDPTALMLDYTRAMMACLLWRPQPRSVLIIGLGGGSLAKYWHAHVPGAVVTVVELNPHVIALREVFLLPADDARLQVVCGDGAAYVRQAGPDFDVVMVDGFDRDGQVDVLATSAFYSDCRRRLAPGGVLVVNLHADNDTEHHWSARIAAAFDGRVLSVKSEDRGNRIVFAGRPCASSRGPGWLRKQWDALPRVHRETLAGVWPALLRVV